MTGNTPDDVTPGDIDEHFGDPDKERIFGSVTISSSAEVTQSMSRREKKDALIDALETDGQILHVEIEGHESL